MKTRNGWVITIIAIVSLGWAFTSAWAGSASQHRWEGVAMGAGAVIVGSALVQSMACGPHGGHPVAVSFNYRHVHRHPPHYRGNWKRYHRGHRNPGPDYDRGPQYRRPSRKWNTSGTGHRRHWNITGRKAHNGHGRHFRGYGGQRR